MFSHDTERVVPKFTAFDKRVEGRLEFSSYSGSKEPRQKMTVKETFACPRDEALK